jgi:hypothetical protein
MLKIVIDRAKRRSAITRGSRMGSFATVPVMT